MENPVSYAMSDLLLQGVELMLLGMGTVFVFLTVLVLATQLMSRLVRRGEGSDVAPASAEEIAAITAALELHRSRPA